MAGIKLSLIDKQSDKILANCPDNCVALQYSSGGGQKVSYGSLRPEEHMTRHEGVLLSWILVW